MTDKGTGDMRNPPGFTLVELIVVVAILGILALAGMAGFGTWFAKGRISGAAAQLYTEMQQARMKAISKNVAGAITFDTTSNNSYTVYDDVTAVKTVVIGDYYEDVVFGYICGTKNTGNTSVLTCTPAVDPVTFGGSDVTFQPTGLAELGTVYLRVTGDDRMNMQRAITVNIAGRIKLYVHNGSSWE